MRTEYLTAIVLAAFAAGAGMAVYSMRGQSDFCPQPWAASVTAFFAPCQAFYSAMVRAGSQAVRVSLLTPAEKPDLPPPLLAARLARSVDPFLHQSGGEQSAGGVVSGEFHRAFQETGLLPCIPLSALLTMAAAAPRQQPRSLQGREREVPNSLHLNAA